MIIVTGATGKLGRHIVEGLLKKAPANQLAIAVRSPEKAADFAARGVQVRRADYNKPETIEAALAGAEKVLLISASEIGQRVRQHATVIEAAKKVGVPFLVYTSLLHTDTSSMSLAAEHKETERLIRASGIPFVFLRNGWYMENYTENLSSALEHGVIAGSAGEGRIAAATRADFAAAAVAVLTGTGHENKTYELAGDTPFTMAELAAEVSRQSGKSVVYKNLLPEQYREVLLGADLPKPVAEMLVEADLGIARGELFDSSGNLRRLINRPTTPLSEAIASALKP